MCEELSKLKVDALVAFAEAKRVRRCKDLSFHEDAELSCDGYRRIDALIMHLLAGHDGEPCPDGGRPIVSIRQNRIREDEEPHVLARKSKAHRVGPQKKGVAPLPRGATPRPVLLGHSMKLGDRRQ